MKKLIAKWSHILALLILPCSLLTAQTFTIHARDACVRNLSRVGGTQYRVQLPGILNAYGFTSSTGDVSWSIGSSDPAGTYTITLEQGVGSSPAAYTMVKNGSSVNAFFTVRHPGKPDFSIAGTPAAPQVNGVIQVYKCGDFNTAPVGNLSTLQAYIGAYRFTIFNSNASGHRLSQASTTGWMASFPSEITMPANPTGQYYIVRLQVQNQCEPNAGSFSSFMKEAWVRWQAGTPAGSSFLVNRSAVNCMSSNSIPSNPFTPGSPMLMRPLLGGIVTMFGSNFTQNRIQIHEVNSSGAVTGLELVVDKTFSNNIGEDISARNFLELFDGQLPIWASSYLSPWINANSNKTWRMSLYLYSPECGWSEPRIHYFRVNTNCPLGTSLDDPDDEGLFAREVSDFQDMTSSSLSALAWPNPVSDMLRISLAGIEDGDIHIDLFDTAGRRISLPFNPVANGGVAALNVSSLPRGTYAYRFVAAGGGHAGRFVKM